MRKYMIALLLGWLGQVSVSQAQTTAIDSLSQLLQQTTQDSTQSVLYGELGYEYIRTNLDSDIRALAIVRTTLYALAYATLSRTSSPFRP